MSLLNGAASLEITNLGFVSFAVAERQDDLAAEPAVSQFAIDPAPPVGPFQLPVRWWVETDSRILSASWMPAFLQKGSEHDSQ